VVRARLNYAKLAGALLEEGDTVRATAVIDRCLEQFPTEKLGYDFYFPEIISVCFAAGRRDQATGLSRGLADYYFSRAGYLINQVPSVAMYAEQEIGSALQIVSPLIQTCYEYGETELAEELNTGFNELYAKYMAMRN
jgi:hypothetical protein